MRYIFWQIIYSWKYRKRRYYPRTLLWVNYMRLRHGHDIIFRLPRGWMTRPHSCPVARGLGGDSYLSGNNGHLLYPGRDDVYFDCPSYVATFIRHFDCGRYPRLRTA